MSVTPNHLHTQPPACPPIQGAEVTLLPVPPHLSAAPGIAYGECAGARGFFPRENVCNLLSSQMSVARKLVLCYWCGKIFDTFKKPPFYSLACAGGAGGRERAAERKYSLQGTLFCRYTPGCLALGGLTIVFRGPVCQETVFSPSLHSKHSLGSLKLCKPRMGTSTRCG